MKTRKSYQLLSDAYIDFLKLVLEHPDLKLRTQKPTPNLTDEQRERMQVLFEILISLFERAYLTAYTDDMTDRQRRRWLSWDDFMREWCRRDDFRTALPVLLQGEDAISPNTSATSQGYHLAIHRELRWHTTFVRTPNESWDHLPQQSQTARGMPEPLWMLSKFS